MLAHARFERRCGSREDVLAIYNGALPRLDAGSDARGLVQAALARFQLTVLRDANAARVTLENAIREAPQCRDLWVAYYALEAAADDAAAPKRVSAIAAALDDSTVNLPMADQKALWALYLQHVEDMGPEIGPPVGGARGVRGVAQEDAAAGLARVIPVFPLSLVVL